MSHSETLCLVEAGVRDLQRALNIRAITSVELVSLYLHRIGKYDCRGPRLNSVCVLNPNVFNEAQASDDYRASGRPIRPLEGIPFTVKDSFMVQGMTVAAGSPAFVDLIASEDAAIVESLRKAGAVLIGKTNMPPMADGGSQRGLYGRAESPYNPKYSTTAYASGSSNGCGTSTAASFAAFGFAGETVSSGRAPASNNALVGYSPSRGIIPNRGQWPLYPTCDVIVPHTRSMYDLFDVLNIIVADDPESGRGIDFWRRQNSVSIPKSSETRPADYRSLEDPTALKGKRIAVPRSFLGIESSTVCSDSVRSLWELEARAAMESLGAIVIETDFPLYEKYTYKDFPGQSSNVPGMTVEWTGIERCQMIAMAWDDFLGSNADEKYPNLATADPDRIHPLIAPMDDPSLHTEAQNQVRYPEMIESVRVRRNTLYDFPGCAQAVSALEMMRKRDLEDWMDQNDFDLLAFPTNGDVAYADADESLEHMLHALQDGVKYSNGGRMLKHLGVPCITVPMGMIRDKQMPVGITFCAKAYADDELLRCAFAYEAMTGLRTSPPLTPVLPSDLIPLLDASKGASTISKPVLSIESTISQKSETPELEIRDVQILGTVESSDPAVEVGSLAVFVNGEPSAEVLWSDNKWTWRARISRPIRMERFPTPAPVPRDQFMVVVIAKTSNGRSAALLVQID
ncbi:amidase family protein [Melanomma pulvis-pyrius CBS 109.77]|uniref:Amidase family protein n=1 Tax=Melanomma pulvis-pyrius CBS 109.77 TaxID=1314802 RepID=A0A6A6WSC5_9PLEO|nr:amidase family protein [Melanomma pulvis-pyrius CBS 109.77]